MFAPGARIGSFEVLSALGVGGMGEVYRARDTRLEREVAIKVLPADRLADEGRRRRFVQEAKAASALNHPHIVTIHEIESADGIDFIVMECVQGQNLDALVPKKGMPVREALRLAIPIADALVAAHAEGIVHRDVKPANVMVTPEGVVKVLDFGLAKLVSDDTPASGDTLTTASSPPPLSQPGAITGTAAYMSPEQATGGAVDARSDVFSFGVVLYEMVTGRRPFSGTTLSELRTAVVRELPRPPRELAPGIPEPLERLILRCLRKEPARRFQHMADVKVELQELVEESVSEAVTSGVGSATRRSVARRPWIVWTAGMLVLGVAVVVTLWRPWSRAAPPATVVQLTSERWAGAGSFSPDGTQIAFLRYFGGTTRGFTGFAAGQIYLVSPLGGAPRRLSDFPARLQLSWSRDGHWLAAAKARSGNAPPGGIHLISVDTGEVRALSTPSKPDAFAASPAFSPDGRDLAYFACEGPYTLPLCDLLAQPLDAELRPQGRARRLTREPVQGAHGLAWARDGRSILYDGLWRVRADRGTAPERLEAAAGVASLRRPTPAIGWPSCGPSATPTSTS